MLQLDLWEALVIRKINPTIDVVGKELLLIVDAEMFTLSFDAIEEVAVFKNDHMTFDTLILRLTTIEYEYEIPFDITYTLYEKINERYVIPGFKIKPLIAGFDKLLVWMQDNLLNMKMDWLDEKQIIDDNNMVINYKKNNAVQYISALQ